MPLPYIKYALFKKTLGHYPREFTEADIIKYERKSARDVFRFDPGLFGGSLESALLWIDSNSGILFKRHLDEWEAIDNSEREYLQVEKISMTGDPDADFLTMQYTENDPLFRKWFDDHE